MTTTRRPPKIRLYALGASRVVVAGDEDQDLAIQPKRLALLSYLTLAPPESARRRSTVLTLFWPESDEQHARWALNQSVRQLRSTLGGSTIRTGGAETLSVNPGRLWCDAVAFQNAMDAEAWSRARDLYRGEFLKGLILPGCHALNDWLDQTRGRLRKQASRAAWSMVDELHAAGESGKAVAAAREAVRGAPWEEPGVRRLIRLLDDVGDRAGAVREYDRFAEWLASNLQVDPAPETRAAIEAVKRRSTPQPPCPSPSAPSGSERSADDAESRRSHIDTALSAPDTAVSKGSLRLRQTAAATLMAVLAFVGYGWLHNGRSSPGPPRSIAVIPCEYDSGSVENLYILEGLLEDLNHEIVRQRAFDKVIARRSMLRYRGTSKPPDRIGDELGVDALVFCGYRESGAGTRFRARVVDTRSGTLLWASDLMHYDNGTSQRLAARAAAEIAQALGTSNSTRVGTLQNARRIDARALNLEKEGRYFLRQMTTESLRRSVQLFNQALALDSSFAAAYAGLSSAYGTLGIAFGGMDPRLAFPRMRDAADRARALDPGLAEARELLGSYESQYGWNWQRAEEELREAVRLNPYSPGALQRLGYVIILRGSTDEVETLYHRALDLSPVDPGAWVMAAELNVLVGRLDKALPYLEKALDLEPDYPPALLVTGLLFAEAGEPDRCVSYLEEAAGRADYNPIMRGRLAYCHALAGDRRAARDMLRDLKELYRREGGSGKAATGIAAGYIGLAEADSAFQWLEAAYEARSGNIVHLLRTPAGWRLAGDPRLEALLGKIGLQVQIPQHVEVPTRELLAFSLR